MGSRARPVGEYLSRTDHWPLRSRPITGLDRSGRKDFVAASNVFAGCGWGVDWTSVPFMLRACRGFAGGFVFSNGSHGSFRFRFEIDDNLLWLRLFELDRNGGASARS